MDCAYSLVMELDRLKSVYRKSFLSNEDRRENSAEHSWHLAVTILAMKKYLPNEVDLDRAMRLALLHDVCEIGAGDVCAYHADIEQRNRSEREYIYSVAKRYPEFGGDLLASWEEYSEQKTLESQWVMVFDKLVPFMLNLASRGRTWRDQGINADMVIEHNAFIGKISPVIHSWMMNELQSAVRDGWVESPNKSEDST